MNVEHDAARTFYESEAERSAWPVEHLERQVHTQLFARLLKRCDKAGVMDLAQRGHVVERPVDLVKSPLILDFLDLPDSAVLRESDIEGGILNKLSQFLLELGKGFAFVLRNLHKVQAGRGVNSPGVPEIPPVVFEELVVNALVHRDYLISAPIRLFVFDDRIEIISPGTLPNNLTVENIRVGNSNLRNPILASFVAKGVLPYRGLGAGVPRALEAWPDIDFRDGRDGGLFVATVRRKAPPADLRGDLAGQVTGQVTGQVALDLALAAGLIEMTQPDKPNSRSQRYRLTPAGKELRRRRGTTT